MNWQPIATAPKDGTSILIFVPGGDREKIYGGKIRIAQWEDFEEFRLGKSVSKGSYWSSAQNNGQTDPTHWMPLPGDPE